MPFGDAMPRTLARGDGASMRPMGRTFPQETFATKEDVRLADELRAQLREHLLRRPAPPVQPWSVGVD